LSCCRRAHGTARELPARFTAPAAHCRVQAARAQLRAFAGLAPAVPEGKKDHHQAPQAPEAADAVIERALTVACPLIKEAFDVFLLRKAGFLDEKPLFKAGIVLP